MSSSESNKTPSRQSLYARISVHAPEAIKTLYDLMQNAKNESVRIAAANKIIDKCLPDLKAIEGAPADGVQFVIKVVSEDGNNNNRTPDSKLPSTE